MSVIWVPKPSPLFVDKLSMTLDIYDSNKKNVAKDFMNIVDEFYGGKLWESTTYIYNKKVYIDDEYVLFQCVPKYEGVNFFRVEYNPAKVDPVEVAQITNLFLPGGYKDLLTYGRVTRIDIATDVKKLSVGDLFFQYPGLAVSKNHLKSGSIQTAYLGDDNSVNQFVVYDKGAEIKAKNGKLGKAYKKEVPSCPLTRIEWRFRPKKICTFKTLLSSTENVFEKLNLGMLTSLPKMPKTDTEGLVKLVVELSKYQGLQQALFCVPKYRRKELMDTIMKSCKTTWWKPEELWKTLPGALERILNPGYPYGHHE